MPASSHGHDASLFFRQQPDISPFILPQTAPKIYGKTESILAFFAYQRTDSAPLFPERMIYFMQLSIRSIQLSYQHKKTETVDQPAGRCHGILMQFASRARILTENGLEEIFPGECILTFSRTPAYITGPEGGDGFSNSYIIFDEEEPFRRASLQYGVPHNRIIHETDAAGIHSLFSRIYMENALALPMHREKIDLLLRELLLDLGRSASGREDGAFLPQDRALIDAVQRVRREMYLNLLEYQTVQSMADAASVSAGYFRSVYKALFGVSPKQDILHARVEKAKSLLAMTGQPFSQIALLCGFENENYFSRSFKRLVRQTPSAYRRQHSAPAQEQPKSS